MKYAIDTSKRAKDTDERTGQVLFEALPWIKNITGKTVVIKYGGAAMVDEKLRADVMSDIVLLKILGVNVVIVHGGGKAINRAFDALNFPVEFKDGQRVTTPAAMDVVRQARFSSAFTFIYSPRPGTPAAAMEQIPRDVVQDRFDRLVALQEQITEENLATFEGRDVEVMITGKLGKKDTDTHRVTGREKTGVLVHIGVPEGEPVPEIGDFVTATVTHAGRHNLLADPDVAAGQTYSVRH